MKSLAQSLQSRPEKKPSTASRKWQDKDYPLSITNIIKDFKIRPPQTFRLWALAKKNFGYIETTVGSVLLSMKPNDKKEDYAGILISKLFPKKKL